MPTAAPLKILHIGNIANNAYNNAKLLTAYGHDNDVICYDYYHVMGSPEWEDADFSQGPEDDFSPNWSRVKMKGYRRPRWFVQGPLKYCIAYLIAKRQKRLVSSNVLWLKMDTFRFLNSYRPTRALYNAYVHRATHIQKFRLQLQSARSAGANDYPLFAKVLTYPFVLLFRMTRIVVLTLLAIWCFLSRIDSFALSKLEGCRIWVSGLLKSSRITLGDSLKRLLRLFLPKFKDSTSHKGMIYQFISSLRAWTANELKNFQGGLETAKKIAKQLSNLTLRLAWSCFKYILVTPFLLIGVIFRLPLRISNIAKSLVRVAMVGIREVLALGVAHKTNSDDNRFQERIRELKKIWSLTFPERTDRLLDSDMIPYSSVIASWGKLLEEYDIVIGYSTDPIIPMLCGKSYFAIEHGTLRTIPFEATAQGRLTALAYSISEYCFITNADCWENACLLAKNRSVMINHPYDEDHGLNTQGISEKHEKLKSQLDADFLFFFPTRQDWVAGTGYADKANDEFLNAFISLREDGYKVGLVCCTWGTNVEQSKQLISASGMQKHTLWVAPLGIVEFDRYVGAVDVVVDQFKLGAFGGVLFKAMSMGSPICTYLNEEQVLEQYDEMPPVINAKECNQIVEQLKPFLNNEKKLDVIAEASRNWIKKYHSSEKTVSIQLEQYEMFRSIKKEHSQNLTG